MVILNPFSIESLHHTNYQNSSWSAYHTTFLFFFFPPLCFYKYFKDIIFPFPCIPSLSATFIIWLHTAQIKIMKLHLFIPKLKDILSFVVVFIYLFFPILFSLPEITWMEKHLSSCFNNIWPKLVSEETVTHA